MVRVRSLVLALARLMPPDDASRDGTRNAMVSGIVSGDAADDRAFDAPFCFGGSRHRHEARRDRDYLAEPVHSTSLHAVRRSQPAPQHFGSMTRTGTPQARYALSLGFL